MLSHLWKSFFKLYFNGKTNIKILVRWIFLPAINATVFNDKNWVRSKTLTDKNIFICRILLVTTRTKVICLKWSDWINLYLRLRLSMIKKEPLLFYLIPKCQVCKKSTIFGKDETPCTTVNLLNLRPSEEIGAKLFILL